MIFALLRVYGGKCFCGFNYKRKITKLNLKKERNSSVSCPSLIYVGSIVPPCTLDLYFFETAMINFNFSLDNSYSNTYTGI